MKNEYSNFFSRIWKSAIKYPNKKIIYDINGSWTWKELILRAESYSHALKGCNDNIIPIFTDRRGETIAAMLGVLFSGRGFAPLNPKQPLIRIKNCLNSLKSSVYIAVDQKQIPETLTYEYKNVSVNLKLFKSLPSKPNELIDNHIIYVLFTSGSTGVPKGVMADVSNLENTLSWSEDMLNWKDNDVIGCCTNFFFDISIFDVFTALNFNVPIAIFSQPNNSNTVIEEITSFRVTSIFGVPTFFSQIYRNFNKDIHKISSLRRIISGGDFFPPDHMLGWLNNWPKIELFNCWGPTETSIVNTMHKINKKDILELKKGKSPPVGKSHPRMPIRIINKRGDFVLKPNERGEIYMLGACVTRGYLGNKEMTDYAYVELEGKKAFRTQDIGFFNENNELCIIGRIGSTVKISGYRIDLGEVETAATSLSDIHQACCVVVETIDSQKELWLAVEPKSTNKVLDIFLIKTELRYKLQNYMVPKRIFILDCIPKNANGKIDRQEVKIRMKT